MTTPFHVIIPARYQSTRFPGKLLQDIHGLTVLERVYRQALLAKPASITIAADHEVIADLALGFGAEVVMTGVHHQSGTDRLAEAAVKLGLAPDAIIVNVQGDEPFIQPELIVQVAGCLAEAKAPVATLCWPIEAGEDFLNPNVVKVVWAENKQALYFSRAPIPLNRDEPSNFDGAYRHVGLYAYRTQFLLDYVRWPSCALEATEALEQLRILWKGYPIHVDVACVRPRQDINTLDDLQKARQLVVEA